MAGELVSVAHFLAKSEKVALLGEIYAIMSANNARKGPLEPASGAFFSHDIIILPNYRGCREQAQNQDMVLHRWL